MLHMSVGAATVHPDATPPGVLNVFQGLAIQHKDCRDADVTDAQPLRL